MGVVRCCGSGLWGSGHYGLLSPWWESETVRRMHAVVDTVGWGWRSTSQRAVRNPPQCSWIQVSGSETDTRGRRVMPVLALLDGLMG